MYKIELLAKYTEEASCEGCVFDEPQMFTCNATLKFPCIADNRPDGRHIIWVVAHTE